MSFADQPVKMTYNYNTGFKASGADADTLMDVMLTGDAEDDGINSPRAHSGCELGLGLGVLALAGTLPLLLRRGRK